MAASPLLAILIGCLVLGPSAGAHAQEDGSSTPEYMRLVAAALQEYGLEHWAEAHSLFERAHAIHANARTLRGMGLSSFAARWYVMSQTELRAALASDERVLTGTQRQEVERILARVQQYIAVFEVSVVPADADLRVSRKPPNLDAEGNILLDSGRYELLVSAPGYESVRMELQARAGRRESLEVQLERLPAAAGNGAPRAAVAPATTDIAAKSPGGDLWPWVATGGAAVAAGVGVALLFTAHSEANGIESDCAAGRCSREEIDRRLDDASIDTLEIGAGVSFGVAALAAAGATYLWLIEGDGDDALAVGVRPGGLRVRGSF